MQRTSDHASGPSGDGPRAAVARLAPRAARALPWLIVVGLGLEACGSEVRLRRQPRPAQPADGEEVRPDDTVPPTAICQATPREVGPFEPVDLVGSDSFDADGVPLIQWAWELVQAPPESNARLPQGAADLDGFTPDLVGNYSAVLTVVNDRGNRSDPCAASFEAVPQDDLYVELTWDLPDENLDLHIVLDGALPGSPGDCVPGNCDHDWGVAGDASDDPYVVHDDVDGTGPDALAIPDPAPGTYQIIVTDDPTSARLADNQANVRIYLDGVLVWAGSRTFEDEPGVPGIPLFQGFAAISLPAGTVSEM